MSPTDPTSSIFDYFFKQGILGIVCVGLILVVIYQQKRLEKAQDGRLEDNKVHANDYRDLAQANATVLSDNTQNIRILSEKIEVAKGRR